MEKIYSLLKSKTKEDLILAGRLLSRFTSVEIIEFFNNKNKFSFKRSTDYCFWFMNDCEGSVDDSYFELKDNTYLYIGCFQIIIRLDKQSLNESFKIYEKES